MSGNTPKRLFNIPLQTKPTSTSFDTRPKQVEAWVAVLPMANTGESARRIYTTLKEMNRLCISDSDRYKALELFREPVNQITRVLKKHFVNQNLPLSPKSQKVADLAIQLHSEMALGYMSVINDRLHKTFSLPATKMLTTCLHRATRYLSNILLFSYQLYIQHPEHVWLQIHRLYLYAEEHKLHNTTVVDLHNNDSPTESSIANLYKQALLLALAGPYRLRQRVTEFVYKALESWAPHCHILKFGEATNGNFAFTINMNTDSAPGFFREDAIPNPVFYRQVDTSKLTNILSAAIHSPESNAHKIPLDILKRLLITWSGHSHRSFSRSSYNNEITITLGSNATHHYIDEIIRPLLQDPTKTCPSATRTLLATSAINEDFSDPILDNPANYTSTPIFGLSNIDDHTPDAWDPDYTYRASNPIFSFRPSEQAANSERKASLYAPFSCKGINESAGGYCLLGYLSQGKDSPKVQVGELIGIIDSTDSSSTRLSVGIIRRIKNWKDGLELGIQKLAPCADAIATASSDPKSEYNKYHRSLALPEIASLNQPSTIITHTWNKVGDILIANVYGSLVKIRLTRQLENSGVFSQFEFSVIKDSNEDLPSNKEGVTKDEFESVWQML